MISSFRTRSRSRLTRQEQWRRGFASRQRLAQPTPGEMGVRACMGAILDQQIALLETVNDKQYTFSSPLLQASIGGHTRHSLDHLRKPLETWLDVINHGNNGNALTIRYDLRARQTQVEHDRRAAMEQIQDIRRNLHALDSAALRTRVSASFMLSGDGHEFAFDSTLSRELAFAVHHCIHHSALVKILIRHHFPEIAVPHAYGMAPSTLNFNALQNSS